MNKERNTLYQHIRVSGTAYEAGRQLGRLLKGNSAFIQLMSHPFMGQSKMIGEDLSNVQDIFERYCPGINDEIRGFADEVGTEYGEVVYYFAYLRPMGANCSLIAVTSEAKTDGKDVMARNYEFTWDDNSMLIETHIENQYRQIGFGCQLFGRFDGMNEYGLCIATAAGVINPQYTQEGFVFPVIVRAILNQCKTVEEAVSLYKKMKVADYRNFIIMDATGKAVLIEAAASDYSICAAGKNESVKLLYATNHYNSKELYEKRFYLPYHSLIRYNTIKKNLQEGKVETGAKISDEEIKEILTKTMPDGLGCSYYEDGMGTMWSILFHPSQKKMEICFGAASQNQWRTFGFMEETKCELHKYDTILRNESVPEGFWENTN